MALRISVATDAHARPRNGDVRPDLASAKARALAPSIGEFPRGEAIEALGLILGGFDGFSEAEQLDAANALAQAAGRRMEPGYNSVQAGVNLMSSELPLVREVQANFMLAQLAEHPPQNVAMAVCVFPKPGREALELLVRCSKHHPTPEVQKGALQFLTHRYNQTQGINVMGIPRFLDAPKLQDGDRRLIADTFGHLVKSARSEMRRCVLQGASSCVPPLIDVLVLGLTNAQSLPVAETAFELLKGHGTPGRAAIQRTADAGSLQPQISGQVLAWLKGSGKA